MGGDCLKLRTLNVVSMITVKNGEHITIIFYMFKNINEGDDVWIVYNTQYDFIDNY